jgi:hypothetical protein
MMVFRLLHQLEEPFGLWPWHNDARNQLPAEVIDEKSMSDRRNVVSAF